MKKPHPKIFALKHGALLCPECRSEIEWDCPPQTFRYGRARCSKAPDRYRVFYAKKIDEEKVCTWEARTIRLEDGDVAVIF